jgi:hypothetical protein
LAHDPQHNIVTTHIATATEYDSTVNMLFSPASCHAVTTYEPKNINTSMADSEGFSFDEPAQRDRSRVAPQHPFNRMHVFLQRMSVGRRRTLDPRRDI